MPWDRASLRPKKKIPKFIRNNNIRFNIIIMESFDEVTMRVKYQMTATSRGAIGGIMIYESHQHSVCSEFSKKDITQYVTQF
jgi:hypothetical protein